MRFAGNFSDYSYLALVIIYRMSLQLLVGAMSAIALLYYTSTLIFIKTYIQREEV